MNNEKARVLLEAVAISPKGLMIEIGCIRQEQEVPEDGFSTIHLAHLAEREGRTFCSFDNEQPTVDLANRVLKREGFKPLVECKDGVQALNELGPISFLYLDSHKDPQFSLDQFRAAELAPGAIVAIDDTHEYEQWKFGKATSLIALAEANDWPFDIVPTFKGWYQTATTIIQFPNGKERNQII
ncbi:hypothetical protein KAR91_49930 [Candidatus Pacearchaeota archaeon]|nr:hypothetical protein [Candidatus Pacearchaeota archaeon]